MPGKIVAAGVQGVFVEWGGYDAVDFAAEGEGDGAVEGEAGEPAGFVDAVAFIPVTNGDEFACEIAEATIS